MKSFYDDNCMKRTNYKIRQKFIKTYIVEWVEGG